MADQPMPLDRRTLQKVYDGADSVVEHPDGSATLTLSADIWRRVKRMGLEVRR